MATALITGASAGLGIEFAKLFAADKHDLILVARRRAPMEELALSLQKNHGIKVTVVDLDLGRPGAGGELVSRLNGASVDFLVNNAGFGSNGPFHTLPLDKELQMIDLNMRTLVELTHLLLPEMLQRKSGKILHVGSTAGFQPGPGMATYYASKAFVNSFSEALSEELRGTGVTSTVLAPGATVTEFAGTAGMGNSRLFKRFATNDARGVALYGYNAMKKGRALAVHGLMNKLMLQSLRISPRFLVRKLVGFLNG